MSFSLFHPKIAKVPEVKVTDLKVVPTKLTVQEFKSADYFVTENTGIFRGKQQLAGIELRKAGIALMRDYYAKKYYSTIELVDNWRGLKGASLEIAKQQSQKDVRLAFIVGVKDEHAFPLIYIKENGVSALFYADPRPKFSVAVLRDLFEMPVYAITQTRQSDVISCFLDALIFAREATSRNHKGEFVIPNLPGFLKANAKPVILNTKPQVGLFDVAKLPAKLCRTSQITNFSNTYCDDQKSIVHVRRNETQENYTQFKSRYKDMGVKVLDLKNQDVMVFSAEKDIDSYLRIKGLKVAMTIEIQFYLNQLKTLFQTVFTTEDEIKFIQEAKVLLRANAWQTDGIDDKNRKALFNYVNAVANSLQERVACQLKAISDHVSNHAPAVRC